MTTLCRRGKTVLVRWVITKHMMSGGKKIQRMNKNSRWVGRNLKQLLSEVNKNKSLSKEKKQMLLKKQH